MCWTGSATRYVLLVFQQGRMPRYLEGGPSTANSLTAYAAILWSVCLVFNFCNAGGRTKRTCLFVCNPQVLRVLSREESHLHPAEPPAALQPALPSLAAQGSRSAGAGPPGGAGVMGSAVQGPDADQVAAMLDAHMAMDQINTPQPRYGQNSVALDTTYTPCLRSIPVSGACWALQLP